MDYHDTLDFLIDVFGGAEKLQKLLGVGPSALSNYRTRKHLPLIQARKLSKIAPQFGFNLDPHNLKISFKNENQNLEILLIITGGIAAYKALELIRRLKDFDFSITSVMTDSAKKFITPLSVTALSGNKVYSEMFDFTEEQEMGHIQLARKADLILVAPATANFIGKLANGLADDLASTICLVTNAPIYIAPAMNPQMWSNIATKDNCATLLSRGFRFLGPDDGNTACGEIGSGRFADTGFIVSEIQMALQKKRVNKKVNNNNLEHLKLLDGIQILITAGPTFEPIDPVRFVGNRSSGKQGYAIAASCAAAGASVCLISGPVNLETPDGVRLIQVETADQMKEACEKEINADCVICAAAVSDWKPIKVANKKIKKTPETNPKISLTKTPDILSFIGHHPSRPKLVIGFAAETDNLETNAKNKRKTKNADWILANPIFQSDASVFNSDRNEIFFISKKESLYWEAKSKISIANKLTSKICEYFSCFQQKEVT